MPYGGWGPPAIDPGTISGLLDPYIARQKELRTGQSLAAGFDALQKGDYSGMAKVMQQLAADNPALATHLLSTYETEQARKRQEAQFQQTQAETGRQHEADIYYKATKPEVIQEGDPEYGGPKGYKTPGLPPGFKFKYLDPNAAPTQLPPASTGAPTPAIVVPPPTPQQQQPQPVVPQQQPPQPQPTPPTPQQPVPTEQVAPGSAARAQVIQALRSGLHGEELMKVLPPNWQRAVKQIAGYERRPEDFSMRGTMQDRKLYEDLATAYDETYSPTNAPIVAQTRSDYMGKGTPTSSGGQIRSANIGADHITMLRELNQRIAAAGVRPTDFPRVNAIVQQVSKEWGHPEITNWQLFAKLVVPEISQVITAGRGGGVHEREALGADLSASGSSDQMEGKINTLNAGMGPRYTENKRKFESGTFHKFPFQFADMLNPGAKKILLEHSNIDVSRVRANDIETLYQHRTDKEAIAAFNQHYGQGRAEELLNGLR